MADFSLHGTDLFGNPIEVEPYCKLADDFIIPPFSVLNAREGEWQERKRKWLSLGIKGEEGRPDLLLDGGRGRKPENQLRLAEKYGIPTDKMIDGGAGVFTSAVS